MNLATITPLVLTYNEEANIGRTLDRLTWADRVVVVDSYSEDATVDVAMSYENVDLVQREFDHFAEQCNYGLDHIGSEWVLSVDADYVCPSDLIEEIQALPQSPNPNGYEVTFVYCVHGTALTGSLYPSRTVLYRRDEAEYQRDGHGHRVRVRGKVQELVAPIYHDDRKPLGRWLDNQRRYARLEAAKLAKAEDVGFIDRLRKTNILAPLLTPLYCLFGKGLILDGWAGWHYTLQRTYAEVLLALVRVDAQLRGPDEPDGFEGDPD